LPIFGKVQGRANDLILTPDGRKLYLLDSLYNGLPVAEVQLIQDSIHELTVRLVPNSEYNPQKDSKLLKDRLLEYLGDVNIQVELLTRIPREDNGKFRPYISKFRR
jgi:phenylacetate-CoA ligase